MKYLNFLIVVGLLSCKTNLPIQPEKIVGTWQFNSSRNIDQNGKWTSWKLFDAKSQLNTKSFTTDGKLLFNGKLNDYCCSFKAYIVKNDTIFLSNPGINGCALVYCLPCSKWKIEKLTETELEYDACGSGLRLIREK